MKIILSILINFLIISNCFPQSGWIQQNSNVNSNLNSIKFINSQTGWCAGDSGKLLKTTNAGNTWIQQGLGFSNNLNSIFFPSPYTGYIVGDSGLTLKTTNGGINWTNITFRSSNLNSIFFVNDTLGYTAGVIAGPFLSPKIYKTLNGGITWDSITMNMEVIYCIYFINNSTGWVTGFSFDGKAYKTTDAGLNWTAQYTPYSDVIVRSVFFIDSLNGWLGSPYAQFLIKTIYKTSNGGDNWYDPFHWTSNTSYQLFFSDINNGWSAGDRGLIWYTSDSGINWVVQTPTIQNLIYRSIYFTDSLTGWCVGDSGRILKTTTGGIITNFTNSNSEIPDRYFLSQNYPNPFNPVTNLGFGISELGFISLQVYNAVGQEVAILVNEKKNPGSYEVEFNGENFPSGIYFYRLEVDGNMIDSKKMLLLK